MNPIKTAFCCVVLAAACSISACTTTSQTDHRCPAIKKDRTCLDQQENVPPRIQIVQGPARLRVILYSDVCFQSNGCLIPACSEQLARQISTIQKYGNGLIQVVGYTGDVSDPKMAEDISLRQANAVVSFLWSKGIATQRLRAVGFGNHDPIASNRSIKASAANRRVEIMLVR